MVGRGGGGGSKARLVLPFAVSAGDRVRAFTRDMEMAAVLYLAEAGKEKGGGRILRKPDEKLVFVAEVYYPVWLVPWSGRTLLFDGFGATAHMLSYDRLPDVEAFNKCIRRYAGTCRAYSVVLSRYADYFKNFVGVEEKTVEGFIAAPDFIQDFWAYLSDVEETEKPLSRKAVLSRIVNEPEITVSLAELSDLRGRVHDDVTHLDASMKLLSLTTREKVKATRVEISGVRKRFDGQIERVKRRVKRRVRRVRVNYDERIFGISRRFETQIQHLRRDRVEFKKMRRHLRAEVNRCEAEIKSCRRGKKKRSQIRWAGRLKRIKKRLSSFENGFRDVGRKMERLEAARDAEVSQQRVERDAHIDRAMKVLRELEASREASIKMKREEIASAEDSTSSIMNQMREMAKLKKGALVEFGRMGMPRRRRACVLAYLPFYLARYEMEGKNRYVVYPPSVVSEMGIMTRMKGALGGARMKTFLQPRSKAITLFLNQLVTLIQKNRVFENEVTAAGIQRSVLGIKRLRLDVKRGLEELKNEEWLSKDEAQALSKLLYIYA